MPESQEERERRLIARLQRLAPFMRRQEEALKTLDTRFAAELRARLIEHEEPQLDPEFARRLRSRLVEGGGAGSVPARRTRLPGALRSGVAVIVILAGVIAGVFGPFHRHATTQFAALVPVPSTRDLTFSYPALPRSRRSLSPTESLIHPRAGMPYAGHLTFTAGDLGAQPRQAHAYRLAGPADLATLASMLGIDGRRHRVMVANVAWVEAASGGGSSPQPLHSIAVSQLDGELVYHDRRNGQLKWSRRPLDRTHLVAAGRVWLTRAGWPGLRMPVDAISDVGGMRNVRQIAFGWPGAGMAATDEATLWIVPNGSVIEAWLWPPIKQGGLVPTQPVSNATHALHGGAAPVAVLGVSPRLASPGAALVRRSRVVSVLSHASNGRLFLVPVYRLDGVVKLDTLPGKHRWYALIPAVHR